MTASKPQEGSQVRKVRVAARVPRMLHRSVLLETWRREALSLPGDSVAGLVQIALEQLPDDLEGAAALLARSEVKRALAERTEVHMQPRIDEDVANRVRLLCRSLTFHGGQIEPVSERHLVIAAVLAQLEADPDAHHPYGAARRDRPAALRRAAGSALAGHTDTPTQRQPATVPRGTSP